MSTVETYKSGVATEAPTMPIDTKKSVSPIASVSNPLKAPYARLEVRPITRKGTKRKIEAKAVLRKFTVGALFLSRKYR